MKKKYFFAVLVTVISLSLMSRAAEPDGAEPGAPSKNSKGTQSAETVKVGAFTFVVPEGWTKVTPSSSMRKAQLEIAQGTATAEVTFFHFGPGQGGTPADNVARWFNQFPGSEAKRKTEATQVGGVKITFAATDGTFSSGMPGGPSTPMTGYALVGAILESPEGDVYVKMTGPEGIVKGAPDAFKKMVTEAAKTASPRA